jgi:hypothetical protein
MMRFLDKSPSFCVHYYNISTEISTTELATKTVDSYLGDDSPVRYNKIANFPLFGFPTITSETEYDELLGHNSEGYSGEALILPDIIVPYEGDFFTINVINKLVLFQVNEVRQVNVKAKSHYYISFHLAVQDYLPKLERQVISKNTAIFTNIGTDERVVLEDGEYLMYLRFKTMYKNIHDYYLDTYFREETTTFEVEAELRKEPGNYIKFCNRHLVHFLRSQRILIFDQLLKTSLILDFNGIEDSGDSNEYRKSIYYAIKDQKLNRVKKSKYISMKQLVTPFSLYRGMVDDVLYVGERFTDDGDDDPLFHYVIDYDFGEIVNRCISNDIHVDNSNDRIISLIVKYFNNAELKPEDFEDVYDSGADPLHEYHLLPLLLYILRIEIKKISLNITNTIL